MTDCKVENCKNPIWVKGLCRKHYLQLWRHNRILERTRFDKNEIIEYETHAEMLLYNCEKRKIIAKTKIDLEDIPLIKQKYWYLSRGYCISNHIGYLHNFILGKKHPYEIDHINRDKLDNRKTNLRVVTHQQNMTNLNVRKNSPLGITGVFRIRKKYGATIMSHYKSISLGLYNTLEEAIIARKQGEIKYWGESFIQDGK